MVPISKTDEYLDLMRRIALPEYLATRGNRGGVVSVPYRSRRDAFRDADVLGRHRRNPAFAGDDFSMAKYYDFHSDYPIEKEARVRHYEVSSQTSAVPLRSE